MEKKLLWWVGAFIFGSLTLQVFVQLESSYYLEALLFVLISALVYSAMIVLRNKNKKIWLISMSVLSIGAVMMIFISDLYFTH